MNQSTYKVMLDAFSNKLGQAETTEQKLEIFNQLIEFSREAVYEIADNDFDNLKTNNLHDEFYI